ncbi:hypothetical protein SMMN14_03798 [Sphaerulina musiva]
MRFSLLIFAVMGSVALAGDEDDNGDLQEYCVCGNNFDPESPIFMTIFNATIDACTGLGWTLGSYDKMPHCYHTGEFEKIQTFADECVKKPENRATGAQCCPPYDEANPDAPCDHKLGNTGDDPAFVP